MIVRLKNEINDIEQQLKQKDTHIQFKDEIIKKLRQQRRSYLKVSATHCSVLFRCSFVVVVVRLIRLFNVYIHPSFIHQPDSSFFLCSVLLSPIFIDHSFLLLLSMSLCVAWKLFVIIISYFNLVFSVLMI